MGLTGKRIVVTGSASGIGAETARQLQQAGAEIFGADLRAQDARFEHYYPLDLAVPESIDAYIAALPSGIDALCNIAGVPPTRPPEQVVKVNLLGLQRLTLGLIGKLAAGASIVNVASLAGSGWPNALDAIRASDALTFDGVAGFCKQWSLSTPRSYFFTKEALVVWTLQHRWTWRDRGIRMNAVSPGPVATPILDDFLATLGERADEVAELMDRSGTPQDVAPLIRFLCSEESAWIRGANIPVDGGMYAHLQCKYHGLL